MTVKPAVITEENHSSYRTNVIDHLTADRTVLLRGQITVVTVLQIHAHLGRAFHLETVKSRLCLGYELLTTCHSFSPPEI